MQVILFSLRTLKVSKILRNDFFYQFKLFIRVFISHLLNENDTNTFGILETRHFDTSNYSPSTSSEVHLLNLINELLLFLRKKQKLCNQNFLHQFHPTLLPQIRKNLFIILKIRSHAKYLYLCELNVKTRKSLRVVSLSFLAQFTVCTAI